MNLKITGTSSHTDLFQSIFAFFLHEKPVYTDTLKQEEDGGLFSAGCFVRACDIPYTDADESVKLCGSFDFLVKEGDRITAYSTASAALKQMIRIHGPSDGMYALIAKDAYAAAAVLDPLGIPYEISERLSDLPEKERFTCIINTECDPDCSLDGFTSLETVMDLNVLPLRTDLMMAAQDRNRKTCGTLEFAVRQALCAYEIMGGKEADEASVSACMKEIYRQKRNIVLIGMPTSGKSTLSALLGRITGRTVYEMDAEAEQRLGTTIRECFAQHGEAYFRALETEIARDFSKGTGCIISCGGGVIKTPETMRWLRYNGRIIRLERELAQLYATGDRPLSANNSDLEKLYEERMPLYRKYADECADNTGKIEDTLRQLLHDADEGDLLPQMFGRPKKAVIAKGRMRFVHARVPSSKSLSQRALIAAALAEGTSQIHYCGHSDDISATMHALEKCGAVFEEKGTVLRVHGIGSSMPAAEETIDCGESGTALRFLIPLYALSGRPVRFRGHGRLMKRPQTVYEDLFAQRNLLFEKDGDILNICGPLKAGVYDVKGNVSSQFISGLLFALPLCEEDSVIHVEAPLESSSYIALTLDVLREAGIEIRREELTFYIKGNQKYHSFDYSVPGDDSQAAVFAALCLLKQVPVQVVNMDHDSSQPDHAMIEIAERFGAKVSETDQGYLFEPGEIKAVNADLSQTPDLGPVLFALAAKAEGTSVFTGTARLRIKESDRTAAMEEELNRLGVRVEVTENSFIVEGKNTIEGGITVQGHNDHRIVMALSVLAAACEKPLCITDASAVNKSWPYFFYDLVSAGVNAKTDE